jgi:hypothetical protein
VAEVDGGGDDTSQLPAFAERWQAFIQDWLSSEGTAVWENLIWVAPVRDSFRGLMVTTSP